jgi:hypothetical protein
MLKTPRAANCRVMVFALLAGSVLAPAALADARQDIIDNAARCKALQDDRQWLDCYYGAAQPMRARLGLPPASEGQIRLSGAMPENPGGAAGSFGAPMPAVSRPDHVSAKLANYTLDAHGFFTVTLSNGQVWRQLSGDTTLAHWNQSKSAQYVVTINSGAFGSYNLQVQGKPERFKVERLR